MVAVLVNLY